MIGGMAMDGENKEHPFYQKPRWMIENPNFWSVKRNLGAAGEDAYLILLEKYKLSKKNGEKWKDKDGRVFVYAKQAEMAKKIGVSVSAINRAFKKMQDAGLIEVKKRGSGKPARVYVLDPPEKFTGDNANKENDKKDDEEEKNLPPCEAIRKRYKEMGIVPPF